MENIVYMYQANVKGYYFLHNISVSAYTAIPNLSEVTIYIHEIHMYKINVLGGATKFGMHIIFPNISCIHVCDSGRAV